MKRQVCSDMVDFRVVDALDSAALQQLRTLYVKAGWITESESADFIAPLIAGSAVAVAAFDGSDLVGFGRALSDGCSDAYIQDVVVDPYHRGQGIGGQIVRRVEGELKSRGVDWIALVGEPGTEKFYSKLGLRKKSGYTLWMLSGDAE